MLFSLSACSTSLHTRNETDSAIYYYRRSGGVLILVEDKEAADLEKLPFPSCYKYDLLQRIERIERSLCVYTTYYQTDGKKKKKKRRKGMEIRREWTS